MDDEAKIRLEAEDNATPNIRRVMAAFDDLKDKYQQVADELYAQANLVTPIEALERAVKRAGATIGQQFDEIGQHTEARSARLLRQIEQFADREQQAVARAAQRENASRQRAVEYAAQQMDRHQEAYLAGQRTIADAAEKTAQAQIVSNRRAERELEDFDHRLEQFGARRAALERKSAEETFFIAQEANQRLIRLEEQRAAQQARIDHESAQRRRQIMGSVVSGGIRGAGNIVGAAPGALGGILSGAGNVLGTAVGGGMGAMGGILRTLTGGFGDLSSAIAHSTGRLGEFLAIGAGFYSMHAAVNLLERGFHMMAGSIVEFQDKMVQVQSLRLGEGIAGEFEDIRAAVLQTSMDTGRSATELGNALFFIEGHSYKGADALMILEKAAKLAASGLGETDQLIRIVTGQMVAYGAHAEEAGHYFDVFAKTEQAAALPIGELSGQFQRLTPVAAALRIPIEQVGATIATISQTGLGASRVITDLAGVLNSFIHATPQQQAALKAIGYPLEQLRADLADPNKGLIAVLQNVWERSAHDINAAGEIFSDRSRALVGFLALVRNSGEDLNATFDKFANTLGTVDQIFAVNQQRMSLQWQRMTAVAQAYGIMLTNELAPMVGRAMGQIVDQLAQGNLSGAWNSLLTGAQAAFSGIMSMLDGLAKDAFGGAYNIAAELANGLMQGANDMIQAVVNAIADMIASFLLGHSWPPRGPLSQGQAGVQRWQQQYASAMEANSSIMTGAAGNVATAVNAELGKIGAGGGSKEGLQMAIANIDQQLLPWKLAADSIKESYDAMLHPLERQIDAIQRIKDLEYDRQQLKFEERDLELRMLRLRAEGDPARRAQLAGQLARAQEQREQHSIDSRIATLNREARNLRPGRGTTPQEIGLRRREIADELNILHLQQQQHRLVNVQLLGQYEQKKAQLDVDKEGAAIAHDRFELEQKKVLQPLLEQRDLLKGKMQAELDIIKAQTDGLEDQRRVLQAQLQLINAREAGQKKAAGAGGLAWNVPEGDPLSLAKKIEDNAKTLAGTFAEGLRTRITTGISTFVRDVGPEIGQRFIGFIVGGMVAGLPGAVGGAMLVPRLIDALAERGVTGEHVQRLATEVLTGLRDGFRRIKGRLEVGDLLGTVEELKSGVQAWVARFQTSFFSAWYSASQGGAGGSETTYTRHTGIGRAIVESIRGELIDGPLDFASLREAFGVLMQRVYQNLVTPTVTESAGSMPYVGPSPIQQMLMTGLSGADFVVGVVGAAAEGLAGVFANLRTNDALIKGAGDLGKALGVLVMGGTPEGMASEAGVGKFVEGLRKLDRAMLDAGTAFARSLVAGFWEGINNAFTPEGMNLHIIPGSFLDRVMKGENPFVALVGGTVNATNMQTTPQGPTTQPGGRQDAAVGGAVGGTWAADANSGLFGSNGPLANIGASWLTKLPEIGMNAVKGLIVGLTDSGVMAELSTAAIRMSQMFLDSVAGSQGFRSHSPSEAMAEIGRDAVAGFNMGFTDESSSTGPLVRMWLRSEVIAQARSILITGESRTGGLASVGIDALQAFGDAFATPPPGLAANMRSLGNTVVEAIMDPIEDPRTGIIARMRRQIDAMPKAPREPTGGGGGGGSERNVMAATGADFVVGGSGGTDSQQIALWATPGERVQVGASGAGRTVHNNFNITVNGGDPDEVREAIAAGIQAGMDDDPSGQLLNAWRTAKAQGANRSIGTQSRGARG